MASGDAGPASQAPPETRKKWAAEKFGSDKPPPLPAPHRCNDRVEDAIQAATHARFRQLLSCLRTLGNCLASSPGEEPTCAYQVMEPEHGPPRSGYAS
jgi:hypothetical protein